MHAPVDLVRPDVASATAPAAVGDAPRSTQVGGGPVIPADAVPPGVQLVWHGLNDADNLAELLASDVPWGEFDVRRHRDGRLVARHDPFDEVLPGDGGAGEPHLDLDAVIGALAQAGRSLKVDLKQGGTVLDDVLALLDRHGFSDDRLWFNAAAPVLGPEGFQRVRRERPGAVLQCPVDFLATWLPGAPRHVRAELRTLAGWGIDRYSVSWGEPTSLLRDALRRWGYELNIYGILDHPAFLDALEERPRSVTADFNFPNWGCFGRGSGEGGTYHPSRLAAEVPAPAG